MSIFKSVLNTLEERKKIKEAGGYIGIPYPFERMSKELPGIQKGEQIIITASSGVGKSKFARMLYIYHVYDFYKKTGYKVKIVYFPLEDSEEKVIRNMICHYLFSVKGIRISIADLDSKKELPLPDSILENIKEAEEYFEDLYKILEVYDSVSSVYSIYKTCLSVAERYGTIIYQKNEHGTESIKAYESKDDTHVIVIIDNLSNIIKERYHHDNWEALGQLSREYCRKILTKMCNFTTVLIQQQEASKEKQEYVRNTGDSILAKIQPSLDGLATNKETQRDAHLVFGLFSPKRYQIKDFDGYNTEYLGNYFRSLSVLKSNEYSGNVSIPLYFDGSSEFCKEMPLPTEAMKLDKVYNYINSLKRL